MRALTKPLLVFGFGATGGAILWWANFYLGIIRGTRYTLGDAVPCLFHTSSACSFVIGMSQLVERAPYDPIVFWIGLGTLGAGLLAAFVSGNSQS